MAYKVFTNGSVLNASEINENLMRQSVAVFSNASARTAAIISPVEGQMTYLEDTDQIDVWSGSAWVRRVSTSLPFAQASGAMSITSSSVTVITFPAGRFTQAPNITFGVTYVTASGGAPTAAIYMPFGYLPSTTSFGVALNVGGAAAIGGYWHAVQMTSAAASG